MRLSRYLAFIMLSAWGAYGAQGSAVGAWQRRAMLAVALTLALVLGWLALLGWLLPDGCSWFVSTAERCKL